jgi:hypothetical protein
LAWKSAGELVEVSLMHCFNFFHPFSASLPASTLIIWVMLEEVHAIDRSSAS